MLSYFKALHIIGFVTWFAGLFYLVRLFVYHAEARQDAEREGTEKARFRAEILMEQYAKMERRLFNIITTPGMVFTFIFGIGMVILVPGYLDTWLYIKLGFVLVLTGYHIYSGVLIKQLARGENRLSSARFRLLNEVPTIVLVAVVFLAVMKNGVSWIYGVLGLIGFGVLLMGGIQLYKWYRKKYEGEIEE